MFDDACARDLFDAFRLFQGRYQPTGRALSPGAQQILDVVSRSQPVTRDHVVDVLDHDGDHDLMALRLLTYDETADLLRVSHSTVKRLVAKGEIATVRIGRQPLIRPDDLRVYIDSLPLERRTSAA